MTIARPAAERFWPHVDKEGPVHPVLGTPCWLWAGHRDKRGYGQFNVGKRKLRLAHRVAWELTNGPIPDGLFACHHCDNPPCVRPDHLFPGTNGDNINDAIRKGRYHSHWSKGMRSPNAQLTETQVASIKRRLLDGEMGIDIAADACVSKALISNINTGRLWGDVAPAPAAYVNREPEPDPACLAEQEGDDAGVVGAQLRAVLEVRAHMARLSGGHDVPVRRVQRAERARAIAVLRGASDAG